MINEWIVIVNPTAGKGIVKRKWSEIEPLLMNTLPIAEIIFSEYRGHATLIAKQAVESGHNRILTIGGDGTNHEVVNGILTQNRLPSQEILYALLPMGTGNDWVKTYGNPIQPEQMLKTIQKEKSILQDVGLIHYYADGIQKKRYFVNVAGMAYDAFICDYADKHPESVRNQLFYLWLVFKCLFRYKLRRAKVNIDNLSKRGKYYTINLGIGLYSGGGMQLVPHANPSDGQFAVTLAGNISKMGVIFNTYRFYNGSIGLHPKVQLYYGKEITVEALDDKPTLVEADGEFLGETPVSFSLVPKALKVIVP